MATAIGPLRGPGTKGAREDLAAHALRRMATAFIYGSPNALSDAELTAVAAALEQRLAAAALHGTPPAEVVRALLRPVFDVDSHCRCRSCEARCSVCRSLAAVVEAPG